MAPVVERSVVTLAYAIVVPGRGVVERVSAEDPLTLEVGHQAIFPALERALIGREAGDAFTAWLRADEAHGAHDPQRVHTFPLDAFDGVADLEVGQRYQAELDGGLPVDFLVVGREGDTVRLDFNHPLAGQALEVAVRILEVSDPV